MPNGKLEGLITIPSGTTLELVDSGGTPTASITAGTYYWSSADSTANDFAAQLAADLTAAGAGDTWTVTISAAENGTGLVTIDNTTHSSWGITWSATTEGPNLRTLCGFTGDISGKSTAQTGTNHAKLLWLPDGPLVTAHGDQQPIRETDMIFVESPAGNIYPVYGQRKAVHRFEWPIVTRAKTHVQGESTTGESYEQFWIDSMLGEHAYASAGNIFRLYWDADTDGTYATLRSASGLDRFDPQQVRENWTGLYSIRFDRAVEVPS